MVIVEAPGALTTIQDLGRFGYERFGVSPAGPMDQRSFIIANLLVGNARDKAAMEITILGPTLKFTKATVIALTGGDMGATCNNIPIPCYTAVAVKAGDVVSLKAAKTGCRGYLAVAGGFDVPTVMGSRATSIQNTIGGVEGRKLAKGDTLLIGTSNLLPEQIAGRSVLAEHFNSQHVQLNVILGPQQSEFTQQGIDTFLNSSYKIENDSNRMGYRLTGEKIEHSGDGNIISDGIATGSIQVPAAGQPIIMLAERQTVGGYPKIATVISTDLPKIGQCKPGDTISFKQINIEEAQNLLIEYSNQLDLIEQQLKSAIKPLVYNHYEINIEGKLFTATVKKI